MPKSLEKNESQTLSKNNDTKDKNNKLNVDAVIILKKREGGFAQIVPNNKVNKKIDDSDDVAIDSQDNQS